MSERQVDIDGFHLFLDPRIPEDQELLSAWDRQHEITKKIKHWMQPQMVAVDIGARNGWHTLQMSRRVGEFGRVLAFEPSPALWPRLIRHVQINHCENTECVPAAVWSCRTELDLEFSHEHKSGLAKETGRAQNVHAWPLDGFFKYQRLDLIRIDAPNSVMGILKGMREILSKFNPRLLIRTAQSNGADQIGTTDMYEALRTIGYRVFRACGEVRLNATQLARATKEHEIIILAIRRDHG